MKASAVAVGLIALLAAGSAGAGPDAGEPELLRIAREHGRPIVLWFTSADCARCRRYERDVLADRFVAEALDSIVYLRVDADTPAGERLVERYGVGALPTLLVLDYRGAELDRLGAWGLPATAVHFEQLVDLALGRGVDWARVRRDIGVGDTPSDYAPGPLAAVEEPEEDEHAILGLDKLDAALERAKASGKPVVVEFGAYWCRPCLQFDERVLPARDVQRALSWVEFLRYDTGTVEGARAFRLYGGRVVPAFVVFDGDGTVMHRVDGLRPVATPERFVAFLRSAAEATERTIDRDWGSSSGSARRFGLHGEVPAASLERSWVAYAKLGGGLVDHTLVGARVFLPLSELPGGVRAAVLMDSEVGVTRDGEPMFDTNNMVGAATATGPLRVGLFAGIGLSEVGDVAPTSLQIPVELSFDFGAGPVGGAFWARMSWLVEDERQGGSEAALIGADETVLGLGFRLPAIPHHGLWIGITHRELMGDSLTAVSLGTGGPRHVDGVTYLPSNH